MDKKACYELGVKLAVTLKGLHGSSGAWEKLIPWFEGPIAGKLEANPKAVFAATANRVGKERVRGFARRAVKERGGVPHVGEVTIDTNKGWVPSGMRSEARPAAKDWYMLDAEPSVKDIREYIDDVIREADWAKSRMADPSLAAAERLKAQQDLGEMHRRLQEAVGAWRKPGEVKPRNWREQ